MYSIRTGDFTTIEKQSRQKTKVNSAFFIVDLVATTMLACFITARILVNAIRKTL